MTTRITVSLPAETVEGAKRAVREGRAASVSAYVAAALEQTYGAPSSGRHGELSFREYLVSTFGEPSEEAQRWADDVLRQL